MGQVLNDKEKILKLCEAISAFEKAGLITSEEKLILCRWLRQEDFKRIGNFIEGKQGINPYLESLVNEVLDICC